MSSVFNEYYQGKTGLTVGVRNVLFSKESVYQRVEILETDSWGNLMVIDGMVMLSERDEFVYHEMLVHPGVATSPGVKRALIIGGGDGGSARELLKHHSVEHVDLVEIDPTVVEASKTFMPSVGAWEDPRLTLHIEDGIDFVRRVQTPYDLIIIDGSDPVGPAEGLFQRTFYEVCHAALSTYGVLTVQTETPWIESYHSSMRTVYHALNDLFLHSGMYLCSIPLYPTGLWSMICASRSDHPLSTAALQRSSNLDSVDLSLRYYNRQIHEASFALPEFVRKMLESPGEDP
ncbi:MAG: polyamine aminopropyltransferase [Balneolaceae bacterium]